MDIQIAKWISDMLILGIAVIMWIGAIHLCLFLVFSIIERFTGRWS